MTETSATNRHKLIRDRFQSEINSRTPPADDNHYSGAGGRQPQKGYRQDIEGLRAVAVLAVILFHAGVPGVDGGFVGVDVFFVISGFLITGMLWREVGSTGTIRLRQFYGGRARRLLPASATVGVVILIGSALLLGRLQTRSIIDDGIASALYVGNYRFALEDLDYLRSFTPPSPFQHYWSLGVEEQFYLVWPAVIIGTAWLIRRARRRAGADAVMTESPYLLVLALVGALSFAVSLVATRVEPSVAFFSLPTRAWELSVGGLVALTAAWWRRLPALPAAIMGWAGLVLILLACTELGRATPYPGVAALLPVSGAALVIGAGCAAPSHGCGRVLALPPMRAAGRMSYSWYLWHWPVVLVLLTTQFAGHPLSLALVLVLVSGGLAVLTLRLIENPLRFAATLRRSAIGSLALGGAATAIAVCVGVALLVLLPNPVGRGPAAPALKVTAAPPPTGRNAQPYEAAVQDLFAQVQAAVAASADLQVVPSNLDPSLAAAVAEKPPAYLMSCFRNFFDVDQPDCAIGDTTSPTRVVLVGDSNAAMWSVAFEQIAMQRHWRLETLSKGGCPMLDMPIFNAALRRDYTECDQWRGHIVARLEAEHPRLVVFSSSRRYGHRYDNTSGFTSYDPAWISGLTRLVQQLRGTGAEVLVLGSIPDPNSWVPDCLSDHLNDVTACSPPTSTAVNESGMAAESAATKAAGGQYADLTKLFCTAERCPAIVGNTLVYHDVNHVTSEYARLLAPVIGALADRAFVGG